jgi:hypothetical protein
VNAFFAADWADNWRSFDGELIIRHLEKPLLICSGPSLIPRELDFVSDLVTFSVVSAAYAIIVR